MLLRQLQEDRHRWTIPRSCFDGLANQLGEPGGIDVRPGKRAGSTPAGHGPIVAGQVFNRSLSQLECALDGYRGRYMTIDRNAAPLRGEHDRIVDVCFQLLVHFDRRPPLGDDLLNGTIRIARVEDQTRVRPIRRAAVQAMADRIDRRPSRLPLSISRFIAATAACPHMLRTVVMPARR